MVNRLTGIKSFLKAYLHGHWMMDIENREDDAGEGGEGGRR